MTKQTKTPTKRELARQQKAQASLETLAQDINTAWSASADAMCVVAVKLAEAKAACEVAKPPGGFKAWCESNLDLSYGWANKLALAGSKRSPAKAIADLREGNAARQKKHRAKAAVASRHATGASKAKSQSYTVPGRAEYQSALAGLGIENRKGELASLFAAFGVKLTWQTDTSALAA